MPEKPLVVGSPEWFAALEKGLERKAYNALVDEDRVLARTYWEILRDTRKLKNDPEHSTE